MAAGNLRYRLFSPASHTWACFQLARPCDGDDNGQICEDTDTPGNKLPPFAVGSRIEERNQATNNEDKVRQPGERHHHSVKTAHLAGTQERPECDRTRLHQMSYKQI